MNLDRKPGIARGAVGGLASVGVLVLGAGPAAAAGGADNVVQVSDTQSEPAQVRASVQVAFDPGPSADNRNVADALTDNGTNLRAMAAAVQVVVVEGSPSDFEPYNSAAAVNSGDKSSAAFAFADQVFIQTSGPVYLSPGARSRLQQIQDQMDDDMVQAEPNATDLSVDQALDSQLHSLADQATQVVESDLQSAGHPASSGAPDERWQAA